MLHVWVMSRVVLRPLKKRAKIVMGGPHKKRPTHAISSRPCYTVDTERKDRTYIMNMSSDEEEYDEQKPLESLDDLPTDDSESVGSSDDDDSLDDTKHHSNVSSRKSIQYDEASSSSDSSSSSSDDSDSSDSESASSDDKDGADEQRNTTNQQRQYDHDDNSDFDPKDDYVDELQNVPLADRILERQEAGLTKGARADKRERKSRALQLASERLLQHKQQQTETSPTKKKKSKHRPTEVSSKRSDFFKRGAPTMDSSGLGVEITAHRYKPRDPRIMGATSKSTGALDSNYEFLQELRQQEISQLKKRIAVQRLKGKKGQKARRKMGLQKDTLKVLYYMLVVIQCRIHVLFRHSYSLYP